MRTGSSTARMVRGATCRYVGAAPSAVGWAGGGGGGGSGGMFADAAPSGLGPGDDAQPQDEQQQRQRRRQQALDPFPDVVVPAPPPPHHHHQDTDATQAGGSDLPVEPAAELDATVLDRVSKMVLGDDNAGGCVGSSEAPSPSTTSTSTSTSTALVVVEDPLPPVGGGEHGTDETAAATGTASTMTAATAATAATARPPARRFRVRTASVTATATGDTCPAEGGEQRRVVNRNNKRDATDLTATPVTNNQTARPTGSTGTAPGDPTPSPVRDVGVHPLLWVGTAGTSSSTSSSAGLLPRLSPPLGLRSPTSACTAAGITLLSPRACLAPSNSPTSTAATPTVTVETICCTTTTTTTTTTNTTTTTTTNATPCPHHQLSKDGTSLTIDGGATGGRKRRMLKKRHRRSNASFLAGGCGGISINMSMSMNVASSSSCGDDVTIPSSEGGGPTAVEGGGCLGGILPDLADILDGACGGGTEDVIDGIGGTATIRSSPCHANGIGGGGGGGGGCPHHPLAAGCGEGSSFPHPFGLVARAARRSGSRSTSPRPPSTTLGSSGSSQGSSSGRGSPERSNHSPEPHPFARPKRPSAPTSPGASVMSQSSRNVFDQRLDRLASGVQMPTARGTAAGSSGGNGLPPPPNLVPKFRASPLPFSANLRLTPRPQRAAASRKGTHGSKSVAASGGGTTGRRGRTGAKSGGNLGATLSVSTGFGSSAAFAAPSSS